LQPVDDLAEGQAVFVRDIDRTHPGVTPAASQNMCEAASVCLARHHEPPKRFSITCLGRFDTFLLQWEPPTPRARNCHANEHDATKDGAYAVILLTVERQLRLVAVGQAETGTGADWFVAPIGRGRDESGAPNLDHPEVLRLEVSGQNTGTIGHRIRVKQQQVARGSPSIAGIAAVVGFERAVIRIEDAVTRGDHEDEPV